MFQFQIFQEEKLFLSSQIRITGFRNEHCGISHSLLVRLPPSLPLSCPQFLPSFLPLSFPHPLSLLLSLSLSPPFLLSFCLSPSNLLYPTLVVRPFFKSIPAESKQIYPCAFLINSQLAVYPTSIFYSATTAAVAKIILTELVRFTLKADGCFSRHIT